MASQTPNHPPTPYGPSPFTSEDIAKLNPDEIKTLLASLRDTMTARTAAHEVQMTSYFDRLDSGENIHQERLLYGVIYARNMVHDISIYQAGTLALETELAAKKAKLTRNKARLARNEARLKAMTDIMLRIEELMGKRGEGGLEERDQRELGRLKEEWREMQVSLEARE